jgi:hypothetical protein
LAQNRSNKVTPIANFGLEDGAKSMLALERWRMRANSTAFAGVRGAVGAR